MFKVNSFDGVSLKNPRHRFQDNHNCTRQRKIEHKEIEESKVQTNPVIKEENFAQAIKEEVKTSLERDIPRLERTPPLVENRERISNPPQRNAWRLIKSELVDPFNQSQYRREILFCLFLFGVIFLISKS